MILKTAIQRLLNILWDPATDHGLAFHHENQGIYSFQTTLCKEHQNCALCVLVEVTPRTEELRWERTDGVWK